MCASQEYSSTVFEKLHAKSKIHMMENHLTSYLTNEMSFQESWIKRFAFIVFVTMYYLFKIMNVTKKGVRSVSERRKTKNEAVISF